ncbi:MAG TPA: glycosyltransferase family 2 protein [Alloiococcus sp.]|nr:glycosyltransferase family 2 protein [Alloiococcus sp.]
MDKQSYENKKLITIIIPSYNESAMFKTLFKRLDSLIEEIQSYDFEFLFINDGSTDSTIPLLREYAVTRNEVRYIDLSRNFGKEVAMLAGFDYAKGDAVVVMDADLQQPPEVIKAMIHWWEQGYDDVYAVRQERDGESRFKKFTSKYYYKILQFISGKEVYPHVGDFRLLDRKCVEALKQIRETERYTKGMYGWIGFNKKEISYHAEERIAGETKWKFLDLFNLALNGITSYSTMPLKIWSYMGFLISVFAFGFLAYEIGKTLLFGSSLEGYPTLIASILFLGGIQLISLGVIGEYLGRVFVETKNRPTYLVREDSNQENKDARNE